MLKCNGGIHKIYCRNGFSQLSTHVSPEPPPPWYVTYHNNPTSDTDTTASDTESRLVLPHPRRNGMRRKNTRCNIAISIRASRTLTFQRCQCLRVFRAGGIEQQVLASRVKPFAGNDATHEDHGLTPTGRWASVQGVSDLGFRKQSFFNALKFSRDRRVTIFGVCRL